MSEKSRGQNDREERRRRAKPSAQSSLDDTPSTRVKQPDRDSEPSDAKLGDLPSRLVTEQMMRGLFGGGLGGRRSKSSQAQDLAYEAAQTRDPLKSAKLCTKALDLDPNCVDAFVHLSQLSCSERPELLKHIRMAVEVGERGLGGPKFFKENRGYFWGLLETRPYMRARAFLAQLLAEQGHDAEAIREYEEMLGLNPNDNQGLRYPLIGLYLAVGNLDGVQRLFKQYEDEGSAVFAWGRVLERFLADDEPGAAAALKEARSVNKHAEKYLAGKKKLPEQMPPYYGIGDENEGIICADALGAAWSRNAKAVAWLKRSD